MWSRALFLLGAGALTCAPNLTAQQSGPPVVNGRAVNWAERGPLTAEKLAARTAGAVRTHALVQFNANPDAETHSRLRDSGVRLLDPLGGGAWFVALPASAPGLNALRAAGALHAAPVIALDKISEELQRPDPPGYALAELRGGPAADLIALVFEDVPLEDARNAALQSGAQVLSLSEEFRRLTVRVARDRIFEFAEQDWVQWIEAVPPPKATADNSRSAELLRVNTVQAQPVGITGEGVKVGIFDGGRVDPHPEFADRLTVAEPAAVSDHATHVAGAVGASGATDPRVKGMAPKSLLYSYTFSGDEPAKMSEAADQNGISISQNSWSYVVGDANNNCSIFGRYSTPERDLDRVSNLRRLSIVFAAANDRDDGDCELDSRAGFTSIAPPASAKNIVTVAAMDTNSAVATFSNFGPLKDGRLKPDITAMGVSVRSTVSNRGTALMSGTSMATPAISGLLALMIERFRNVHKEPNPHPALLKGILLNTATDLGNPGPDYTFGYGLANAVEAVKSIDDKLFSPGKTLGAAQQVRIQVPAGAPHLRVTLAYSDREGTPNAAKALVNDLDLSVTAPGGAKHLPLMLDPQDPSANAAPGVNPRDPVEQVIIAAPAAGEYVVDINVKELASPEQEFFVTWSFAEVRTPSCTSTLVSSLVTLPQADSGLPVQLYRGNPCASWTPAPADAWASVKPGGSLKGSASVRLGAGFNDTGMTRATAVRMGDRSLTLRQSGPCTVQPLEAGKAVKPVLASTDCVDTPGGYRKHFTFDAAAGTWISARMSAASPAFDSYLELRHTATGLLIAADDDGGGGLDARIPAASGSLHLPLDGAYTLVARTAGSSTVGEFEIAYFVTTRPASAAAPHKAVKGCPAILDGELTPEAGREGRRGSFFYTDTYLIPSLAGQLLTVSVPETEVDTVLYLLAPNGRLAAWNDDFEGSMGGRASAPATESGFWRVEVTSFAPRATGKYKLSVEGCTPLPE